MMRILIVGLLGLSLFAAAAVATVAPKDGGPMPQAYFEVKAMDRTAFTMDRAWINKTRQARKRREAFLKERGPWQGPLPDEFKVQVSTDVPVLLTAYANRPVPSTRIQVANKLFDNPSGTVTDYWDEVSYGNLNLTGTVRAWVGLRENDSYYEGLSNGLNPANARTGELIQETLDANDGAVNFALYDNDGPDGVPNSGDDDGFVDFVVFVHSESGGECGNTNMWSHAWVYSGWNVSGGLSYTTNDARFGGGNIRINSYTMLPSVNCPSDGGGLIDIGVFCHEFGHAFGLPDLYDTDGGGQGIGFWGIMGSGNWNQPTSPAHPCAWTRKELGWVTPTDATWQSANYNVGSINANPTAFRLPFSDDHFRRSSACAINGTYSIFCGLTEAEGTTRSWGSPGPGGGYGNGWMECIRHDFTFDGNTPVTLAYAYDYHMEPGYDFAYAIIDIGGTETTLATYNGIGAGNANINLAPHLGGQPPGTAYSIKFRFESDFAWSDEDGDYATDCGAIAIDDVVLNGGGENYSTGFETYVDGWYQDPNDNPYTEYWLVENRRTTGYDSNLLRQGLLIMHIDEDVARSIEGNTGGGIGVSAARTRGVFIEEADGFFNLNFSVGNKGDTGDPWPGATTNTNFPTSGPVPNSNSNNGTQTMISVLNISNQDVTMTADMIAGDPAPTATGVTPNTLDNDQSDVAIAVNAGMLRHGATFHFEYNIPTTSAGGADAGGAAAGSAAQIMLSPTGVEWIDPVRLEGVIDPYAKAGGTWDLVVTNHDGQTVRVSDALTINQVIVSTKLQSAEIDVVDAAVRLRFILIEREPGETVRLHRAVSPDGPWHTIVPDFQPGSAGSAGELYTHVDNKVEPGRTYYYGLDVRAADGEVRELYRGSAAVPVRPLSLAQNYPNPFNPTTTIEFYLPERTDIELAIYNVSGQLVNRLARGAFTAGPQRVTWNGVDMRGEPVSSGIYVYRLRVAGQTLSKKMILLK